MKAEEIKRKEDLCRKFLALEDIGRPLIGLMWEPCILPVQSYVERIDTNIPIDPEDIDACEMCCECDKIIEHTDSVKQDFFYSLQASFNHLWLSAALGCPIKVTKNTIWSQLPDLTLEDIAENELIVDHRWINKLIECHDAITAYASDRAAVAVPWLDGPLDLMVSLLGPEQTAYGMLDNEGTFVKAMEKLNEFVIEITQMLVNRTHQFASGYVSRMHIYSDHPAPTVMNDATWMTSADNYLKFVYPFEKKQIAAFPGSVYHMHNTSTQIMPILANSDLKAIQYTVDPNGPAWDIQRKAIAELQKYKPVVLSCWNIRDAERARIDLPSKGLAITVVLDTLHDRSPDPILLKDFSEWYSEVVK